MDLSVIVIVQGINLTRMIFKTFTGADITLLLLNLSTCTFRLSLLFNIVHLLFKSHFSYVVILLCLVVVCQPGLKSCLIGMSVYTTYV